jgi:hypothetical protein
VNVTLVAYLLSFIPVGYSISRVFQELIYRVKLYARSFTSGTTMKNTDQALGNLIRIRPRKKSEFSFRIQGVHRLSANEGRLDQHHSAIIHGTDAENGKTQVNEEDGLGSSQWGQFHAASPLAGSEY